MSGVRLHAGERALEYEHLSLVVGDESWQNVAQRLWQLTSIAPTPRCACTGWRWRSICVHTGCTICVCHSCICLQVRTQQLEQRDGFAVTLESACERLLGGPSRLQQQAIRFSLVRVHLSSLNTLQIYSFNSLCKGFVNRYVQCTSPMGKTRLNRRSKRSVLL